MHKILNILIIFLLVSPTQLDAQVCTTLGQNPSTAFPVCGSTVFSQNTVPICSSANLYVPGCSGLGNADYQNKNPFWYKFTCFQTGTLGFQITPINAGDDYDWQLYDITGHNPDDIYTINSLIVTGNWSGTYGATGASATGVNFIQCASSPADNLPTFAKMPTLIQGHEYILLVSHYTDTQSGYSLSFGGGTAVITDPLEPHLKAATATCDGTQFRININKKMKCKSLAADGSDFSINTASTNIVAATGYGCNSSFDMDSVILTLSSPIAPGNYIITIGNGSDGNTLQDNCDRLIPVGENIPLTVFPIIPTPMDSLTKIGCAPSSLELVFRKPMLCNSIAADGSDFTVSGPVGVTITFASGTCANGVTTKILVQLSSPLQLGGTYTIHLKNGTDGNTLIDECGQQTPVGSSISFVVSDTVNADFTYNIIYGCQRNSVQYNHIGMNGVNSWLWNFDNTSTSNLQNPIKNYVDFRQKNTSLIVSNGVCKDTASVSIFFDNLLLAAFESTPFACPGDKVSIANRSEGIITSYEWTFGNGLSSTLENPPAQTYPVPATTTNVTIELIIRNSFGCADTATQTIKAINNCYIAVPSAFTPNGDGMNDYLYPLNAYKAKDLSFSVYNRFGQRIFFTRDWTNKWDGTFKGQGADTGTYVWILTYTNTDTNLKVEQKGTTILIR
jgi:gliding motility-associated-like protein